MFDTNDEPQITKKVALYLRVSSEDQVEKFGLPMQQESLEALVKSKGKYDNGVPKFELAGASYIYTDADVSGTVELEERPGFARLMEDLEFSSGHPPFDVVAVYKIDRLARKLKILLKAIDIFQTFKVQVISSNESIDTSTAFGRAILGIVGVIAELEIETTKQRTYDGRMMAIQKGSVLGANPEFGYIKDQNNVRVVLKKEAEIVMRIFTEFVHENKTPQAIANALTDEQVMSPGPSAVIHKKRKGEIKKKNSLFLWRADRIREILTDETYLGTYYYHKTKGGKRLPKEEWKTSKHRHEAIIDAQTFATASKRLKDRSDKKEITQKRDDANNYILSGLLKCAQCQTKIDNDLVSWVGNRKEVKKGSGKFIYSYICIRKNTRKSTIKCSTIPLPANEIEAYVVEFIRSLLANPKAVYDFQMSLKSSRLHIQHLTKRIHRVRALLNAIPGREKQLKEQHEHEIISLAELEEKLMEVKLSATRHVKELELLEVEKAQKEMPVRYIESFEEFKKKYENGLDSIFNDRAETNRLLKGLISRIVISSRELKNDDKVSGPKVEKTRYMPNQINIEMKLPTEILKELFTNHVKTEFVVTNANL